MTEVKKISSSRTNLFKIVLILGSLYCFWLCYTFLTFSNRLELILLVGSLLFLLMGAGFMYLGYVMKSMKLENEKVIFSNMFSKELQIVNLSEIKPYLIREFKVSLLDPLSLNKFVRVKFENENGKKEMAIVLSPSKMSTHNDIPKLLKALKLKETDNFHN